MSGLVNDALAVLEAANDPGLDDEQAEAVALLALVAGQDVEPGERPGTWRIAREVAKDRVISTVDPQARHTRKTSAAKRDGYKAHIAAEPSCGLVTQCALTAANIGDGPTGVGLLADEDPGLEVLGDTGYGSGQTRAALRAAGHHPRLPHRPVCRHPQVPGGLPGADHQLGPSQLHKPLPVLPAAQTLHHRQGWPHDPHPPPRRRAARRPSPRGDPQLPAKLPALAANGGTIHRWLVADGCRRVPYRGIDRNDLWWSVRVAAVNLRRLLVLGLARQDGTWTLT